MNTIRSILISVVVLSASAIQAQEIFDAIRNKDLTKVKTLVVLPEDVELFKKEIDLLSEKTSTCDFAIVETTPGQENIYVSYLEEKLKPKVIVPYDRSGNVVSHRELSSELKTKYPAIETVCVHYPGDRFHVRNGKVVNCSSIPAQGAFQDDLSRKIAELAKSNADLEMFSGTLLVAKKGEVIYEAAFGEANKDYHVPNKPETRFNIGSIGKTITAVAIMQLVQEGKLKLSETLGKFYPECPFPEKDAITIYHLLTHTSGLGDYLEHKDYRSKKETFHFVGDALPLIFDQKPCFKPGEKYKYSNSAFYLLGGIVQKVSSIPYRKYIRERIFKPCGMTETDLVPEDEVLENRAIGYTQNVDGSFTANILTLPSPCPAGGLRSTARDLLKFDQALGTNVLLSDSIKRIMFTPSTLSQTTACGWEVKEFFGEHYNGHSGGADGTEAFFYRFLDSGYTLIVLSNYHNGAEELTSNSMNLLFNRPYSLPTVIDANFRLGYRMQGENKLQEAAIVLERNLTNNPPHLLSLFFSANVRIRGNFELEKAIEYLDLFLRLAGENDFPPPAVVWEQKAMAFQMLGRMDDANHALEKLLELDPQNQWALEKQKMIKSK